MLPLGQIGNGCRHSTERGGGGADGEDLRKGQVLAFALGGNHNLTTRAGLVLLVGFGDHAVHVNDDGLAFLGHGVVPPACSM